MASEITDRLQRRGLRPLAPKLALELLAAALEARDAVVAVADIDWSVFADVYTASRPRPLISELVGISPAKSDAANSPSLVDELVGLSTEDQEERLLDLVLGHTAAVLGVADPSTLEPGVGFSDLGLDSLMALELRQRLQRALGSSLPATLIFDFPTPVHLRDLLFEEIVRSAEGGGDRDDSAEAEAGPGRSDELEQLDSDDLLDAVNLLLGDD